MDRVHLGGKVPAGVGYHVLRHCVGVVMKLIFLIGMMAVTILTFALVPDHAHGMVYIGSSYLILSYILIPRRPQLGWVSSMVGNALYLYPVAQLHRIDLMVVPAVF